MSNFRKFILTTWLNFKTAIVILLGYLLGIICVPFLGISLYDKVGLLGTWVVILIIVILYILYYVVKNISNEKTTNKSINLFKGKNENNKEILP
jgi:asparagine N-glycosylation enzyme membrane subunit Stt3